MQLILTDMRWLGARPLPLHPGYIKASRAKLCPPAEIYDYPAMARRMAATTTQTLRSPEAPRPPQARPSLRGLWATYATLGLVLWIVAATLPVGA